MDDLKSALDKFLYDFVESFNLSKEEKYKAKYELQLGIEIEINDILSKFKKLHLGG